MENTTQENSKESVWSFFIKRRSVCWFLIIGACVLGFFSITTIPREIQPEINIPYVFITTILPGANPLDTETLITKPLEQEIGSISNIKTLSSSSTVGASSIFIEFEASADVDTSLQDVKDAVSKAKPLLPDSAMDPIVAKVETNKFPIITFSIIGEQSLPELTEIAEKIQERFEKISGVSNAEIIGGQNKYIEININPDELNNYGMNIQNVSDLLKYSNFNLPIGLITTDKQNYSIRIDNKFRDIKDIKNIPLFTFSTPSAQTILLKDIADIQEKYTELNIISSLSVKGKPASQTVSIRINKKDSGNILEITDSAKTAIEELKNKKIIPESVEIFISNDNSAFIRDSLGLLTKSGLETVILVIMIIFLGLGLREGILAGLSIPLTFVISFPIMEAFGLTLNNLTLFSLVIALGIMVDVAIVIMQGTHANLKNGLPALEATLLSVNTYKWPLIAGIFTTISAFFPMLLVSGIIGQFLKSMPITLIITLITSLIVSLTLIPSLGTKFLSNRKIKKRGSLLEPVFNKIGQYCYNFLHRVLRSRVKRISIVVFSLFAFLASVFLPISGILKSELFPRTNMDYFIVDLETPVGLVLEETENVTKKIEAELEKIPEIDNFLIIVGSNQAQAFTDIVSTGASTDSNLANITVNLKPKKERARTSYEIADEVRGIFKNFTEAKISVREIKEGPPSGTAITVRILGENLETLKNIANDIKKMMESIPGTQNITTTFTQGTNEFVFRLDPNKLSFYGLNTAQVSMLVRNTLQGLESTTVTFNEKDYDIFVKYNFPKIDNKNNFSINKIEDIIIRTPKGSNIPLSMLGKYELVSSEQNIQRESQKRIIKVQSDLSANVTAVESAQKLQKLLDKYIPPENYEIKIGGDTEEIAESFMDLYKSMFIGIILIGLCLILIFNSFKQAIINLLTLPLGIIGVFPGLLILGLNLSFPAFLGIVALAGIVVNHVIVLIDKINVNRKNGLEFTEAIAEASKSRLEPILMTSLTTIIGVVPLALTDEFWAGLGFSIIFGLSFSTFFTLNVIPTLYYMFEANQEKKRLASESSLSKISLN